MFKVILPKIVFKELEKIDSVNKQLVFDKIKDLENGHFENDKSLQGKHKGKFRKRAGNYRIIYLMHISEYSDSNVGVQPDTFAMRFSSL